MLLLIAFTSCVTHFTIVSAFSCKTHVYHYFAVRSQSFYDVSEWICYHSVNSSATADHYSMVPSNFVLVLSAMSIFGTFMVLLLILVEESPPTNNTVPRLGKYSQPYVLLNDRTIEIRELFGDRIVFK